MPAAGAGDDLIRVYLETGAKRVFACALDWPGWCRSGKDDEAAVAALAASRPRYEAVIRDAGLSLSGSAHFEAVERIAGSATTDFGAPGTIPQSDRRPLAPDEVKRLESLLAASWSALDRAAAAAPAELRKGPRGGGRNRDAILQHVLDAETAYASKLGLRLPHPARTDPSSVAAQRGAILGGVRGAAGAASIPEKGWPALYAARRTAWHAIDHAWEIEDRSQPSPG